MESKTGKTVKKLLVLNISDLIFFLKLIKNTNLQEIKKFTSKMLNKFRKTCRNLQDGLFTQLNLQHSEIYRQIIEK